jgi:hypothetical protein
MLHQKKKNIILFFLVIKWLFSFRMALPNKRTGKATKAKAPITIEK